eukprot:CAMPEP_0178383370 /NCGR_PEP_ID=MMETSP0689_2-20121128/6967_1 /TAXON_ID=160604 /ORGANISM="Amphidinium massartii, Strain CS-259" /LENGTH=299 /DNA_ID=CAMNT_0020003589 /DNA_START=45 /DNA_END=940 /DNA_ORIENTATION=+
MESPNPNGSALRVAPPYCGAAAEHLNFNLGADVRYLLAHSTSGAIAGVISRTLTAPADRVRTLMQAGMGVPLRPPGMSKAECSAAFGGFAQRGGVRRAVVHVYMEGGVRGFFRGNGANCLKMVPDGAAQFGVSNAVAKGLATDAHNPSLAQRVFAGGVAGAVTQTIVHPFDVVKTQMVVANKREYNGLVDCFRRTARDRTLGGTLISRFYRGYLAALMGIVPYMATKLGSYQWFCDQYKLRHGSIGAVADQGASVLCTLAAIFLAYPLNLARVKLQVQGVNGRSSLYDGVVDCLRKTVR